VGTLCITTLYISLLIFPGQLGIGGDQIEGWKQKVNVPTVVSTLSGSGVVGVCGGSKHSVALLACDEVWSWGTNDFGQLGQSDNSNWPACAPIGPTNRSLLPRCVETLSGVGIIQVLCSVPFF
jgi:alpha-tubulin suppressor-like RCC1 family protein